MATIYQMDKSKGLDLILHTPGGDIAATESLVEYLRQMFGNDIRAIVPQLALSAGTMIALACDKIVMGKHSSLGPIDPQLGSTPAHAVVEEWERAHREAKADPLRGQLWQLIINKYPPGLVGSAEKVLSWAEEVARGWLVTGMFRSHDAPEIDAKRITDELCSQVATKTHNRHIGPARAQEFGLAIKMLEDDQTLQELVLTVHHACMLTLADMPYLKLIENHHGIAYNQLYEPAR